MAGSRAPEGRSNSPRLYRKPDLATRAAGSPAGNDAIPTLVVEVRSPDETMASQRRKCRMFREHGLPACWLIDRTSRSIEVFEDDLDGETLPVDGGLASKYLPGFELKVPDLFATLDR